MFYTNFTLYSPKKHKYNTDMTRPRHTQRGGINASLIAIIGLTILFIASGATAIYTYLQYRDASTNLDAKVNLAVAKAQNEQSTKDETTFAAREKEPNRQFVGPDDYGRVTFDYPKTWSVYESNDVTTNGGTYQAYLNPVKVPPVSDSTQVALRVKIEQSDYGQVLQNYQSLVKNGKLTSSSFSANGHDGTRLDGSFTDTIRGSAVIFKIRDKTLTVRTDADTFKPDFDALIKTINFND